MLTVAHVPAITAAPYLRFVATMAGDQIRAGEGIQIIYYRHPRTTFSATDYAENSLSGDLGVFDKFADADVVPVVANISAPARAAVAANLNRVLGTHSFIPIPPDSECLAILQQCYKEELIPVNDKRQLCVLLDADVPERLLAKKTLAPHTCHVVAYDPIQFDAAKRAGTVDTAGIYYTSHSCALPHILI